MTCHHDDPHAHDYRAATVTGNLVALLHRHNRLLIVMGAAVLAVVLLTAI
jgi:hypothetical protein